MIKNLTVKSRTRLFVIFTICTIFFLILVAPIMFNFKAFFEIGLYTVEDDFTNEYSDGTGGFHAVLTLQYEELEFYIINADITPISSGDVVHYGFLYAHNNFLQNTHRIIMWVLLFKYSVAKYLTSFLIYTVDVTIS